SAEPSGVHRQPRAGRVSGRLGAPPRRRAVCSGRPVMNNTVRIALAVAYAAVGIWALMPTPPKPLAAATSPPPPPPIWERPRYERPAPMPRPRRAPEDMVQPDEYRGSDADDAVTAAPAALHPEPVRKPSVEMTPADLWALANLTFGELPPIEFDHYPDKSVTIKDISTEKELRVLCGWPANSSAT